MKQQRHADRSSHAQAQAPRSQAQALDSETRAFLEPRFGHHFGDVRVYADEQANQLAQSHQARALTVGQEVFFSRGEYNPNTPDGLHLLAHELTHTIQQRDAKPQRGPLEVGQRDSSSEREASRASSRVMTGQSATVQGSAGLSVQCFRGADDEWKQNRDQLEASRDINAMLGIPLVGNIGGIGAGTAKMLLSGYNSIAGDDKKAQSQSLDAQQLFLKSVPGIGNDLAIRDAITDQQAIDNLYSGKAIGPKLSSLDRRDGQIKQFNQDASDGARGLWDDVRDGVVGIHDGGLDVWYDVRDGVADLYNGATDTPTSVKTNSAQSVVEHSLSQGFEHGAVRGKITPPSGPVVETFSNDEPWLPKAGE